MVNLHIYTKRFGSAIVSTVLFTFIFREVLWILKKTHKPFLQFALKNVHHQVLLKRNEGYCQKNLLLQVAKMRRKKIPALFLKEISGCINEFSPALNDTLFYTTLVSFHKLTRLC